MFIAEIVPVSCLEMIKDNYYHMCLAHLVLQSDEYANFYKKLSDEGKYIIMDNGAAEGEKLSDEDLLKAYEIVDPSEIILPDILFNKQETFERSIGFYEKHRDQISKYNIMVVPQGKEYTEWVECLEMMFDNVPFNTVGIPKWLGKDSFLRVDACEYLKKRNVEIHLLGCNENPTVIKLCKEVNNNVRGCDSAFAYLCSKVGMKYINKNTIRPDVIINFLDDTETRNLKSLMKDFETTAGVINNKES